MERLAGNYPFMVMDNEAGMEHISRLTTKDVDVLLIVTDTSRRGLQAALRIDDLARRLNIGVGKSYVVINQVKNGLPEQALDMIKAGGLELAGSVPDDDTIYEFDFNGQPTIKLPEDSPSVKAAFEIFEKIVT
jgi:CO dehydrogenase maturation factor